MLKEIWIEVLVETIRKFNARLLPLCLKHDLKNFTIHKQTTLTYALSMQYKYTCYHQQYTSVI